MKIILLILIVMSIDGLQMSQFEEVLTNLKNLEKYIREYIKEKKPSNSLTHLITCYIREGAYTGTAWGIAGGSIPTDLPQYIKDKDSAEGTGAQVCKSYKEIELPNNEKLDFVHFFAVMNGIENGNSYEGGFAHLVGWGGDTFQLLQDIKKEKGEIEELMEIAKTFFGVKGGFGPADLVSDLDAPIILKKKTDDNDFAYIIKEYYSSNQYLERYNNFIKITFPSLTTKDKNKFREVLYNLYDKDTYINVLECQDNLRAATLTCYVPGKLKPEYANHQKAAVYVVSDYFFEKYNPESESEEEEKKEKEEEKKEEEKKEEEKKGEEKSGSNSSGFSILSTNLHFISIISMLILML